MASLLKHTITPAGQGGDFNSLADAMAHLESAHGDLPTADVYAELEIGGDWSGGADTAPIDTGAYSIITDPTRYIRIYTTAAARHDGKWDEGAYRLEVANATALYVNSAFYCHHMYFDDIQIGVSAANANYQSPLFAEYTTEDGSFLCFRRCILRGSGTEDYRCPSVFLADSQWTSYFIDCAIYGASTLDHSMSAGIRADEGVVNIYNSVVAGGKYGIMAGGYEGASGVINAKNTYCGGSFTEDFAIGSTAATLNKVNCASEDSSADDTGDDETATDCITGVALDADTFVNVTGGSEDFHLAADGNSPLQGAGYDNSGESAPLNYTVDIDGDTMVNYSIGIDDGPAPGVTGAGAIGSGFAAGTAMMRGTIQSEV
jgi:hypothetical protein